ncbi:ribonuclease HI family protein [Vagococcus vulneris]|uniref:RNase H type-1 domain-containing protein n=1 Tax=Vagococcus vulneris TaxID=1977869 RepID=A0A429ZZQ6_9ENTE|nr:ribonuclease HI family protein [Vagococcus vulneris]RST99538.1 hypothetical protein CBF37_04215 [Vagococcus vulneris]
MLKIYIDAATHPKKKISAGGMVIISNGTQTQIKVDIDAPNNHLAEFKMLEYALNYCVTQKMNNQTLYLYSDSKIVVQSVEKHHVQHADFKSVFKQIQELLLQFDLYFIQWIPEKENLGADQLAKQALRKRLG